MDERFMRRAIALSRRGFPAPNPHVGSVIVQNGTVVGEGFHDHAGGPHAERVALARAGEWARGADVYVTLEPCNHTGRTGPCSEALIAAGVRRVFVASPDPNLVATGGAQRLREAGIDVTLHVLEDEAARENRPFLHAMRSGRPWVVAKAGMSLDGRIALPSGESRWITGTASRRAAHRLRAELGAVVVGYRTVVADDPQLTARIPGVVNQPLRVVLDPRNALTGRERVFDGQAPTLHVLELADNLPELARELVRQGVTGLLVEGGGRTIARFLEAELVDALELFVAPKILGDGPAWAQGLTLPDLAHAPSFVIERTRRRGVDLQVSALFSRSL